MEEKSKFTKQLDHLVNGNQDFYNEIYSDLLPKVKAYIIKNSGSKEEAEEIFQDGIFQVVVRAKTKGIQLKASLDNYLFIVCKNLWLQELRIKNKKVRNSRVIELHNKNEEIASKINYQEKWDLFEEKFEMLSKNCKAILNEFFKKVPYKEIVKKFNYNSENTAFQRVFKCKKRLAELINSDPRFKKLK